MSTSSSATVSPVALSKRIAALIERLEDDIAYDCHSDRAAYCRSKHTQPIFDLGEAAFPAIADHLLVVIHRPDFGGNSGLADRLRVVWLWFVWDLAKRADIIGKGPLESRDLRVWQQWLADTFKKAA